MMEKLSIQQTAQRMDVAPSTLRYYEEIGLLPGIQRNGSGHRFYEEQDLGWISWIKLLRSSGFTRLPGLRSRQRRSRILVLCFLRWQP